MTSFLGLQLLGSALSVLIYLAARGVFLWYFPSWVIVVRLVLLVSMIVATIAILARKRSGAYAAGAIYALLLMTRLGSGDMLLYVGAAAVLGVLIRPIWDELD